MQAYSPASGELLWSRALSDGAGAGSAALGYGREIYVQSAGGAVVAFGEGWAAPPARLLARPVQTQDSPRRARARSS